MSDSRPERAAIKARRRVVRRLNDPTIVSRYGVKRVSTSFTEEELANLHQRFMEYFPTLHKYFGGK